ncbi:YcbK family protein [Haliangium sp.]|uniref:YcbK family protein n=1 Tax=Haliangium sp. TaxID=2663208 RepID=UPI003D0F20E5
MRLNQTSWFATLLLGLALAFPLPGELGEALAKSSRSDASNAGASARTKQRKDALSPRAKKRSRKRAKRVPKMKVCKRRNGKRRCRWEPRFDGHGIATSKLRTEDLPDPSGDIWVYAVNFREEVKVNLYDDAGELDPAALAELDHLFRCRRTGEERAVDPRLYEILSLIYDEFGQRRINLVSGFRNQPNQGSRHFHASAMDIHIEGVSDKKLYQFAESLDAGGMGIGIYPTSGFVHVDFRAPGEKSYRWTDYSGPGGKKKKARKRRSRRPNS